VEVAGLGVVLLTLTATALQGVAVGQIARIGAANATAKAYGLILLVDAVANNVWLVAYSPKGALLAPGQITPGTDVFSIPAIGSISVAYHREALVYATREMLAPSPGSGANAATQTDPQSGISLQVWAGSYELTRFRESRLMTLLTGAKVTDYRKAVLMVSL